MALLWLIIGYILGCLTVGTTPHDIWLGFALLTVNLLVKSIAGEALRPWGKRIYRWSKRENTRLGRVFLWVVHYWGDHDGHKRDCQSCSGWTAFS